MRLADLVATSQRVGDTRRKKEKIAALAATLSRLRGAETALGARYLAGTLPQGKIGLGYAKVFATLEIPPASAATLTLVEVDERFSRIATDSGPGSGRRKEEAFLHLLARATRAEQDFLRHLVVGELRHGALEGLMLEAIAEAASVPAGAVRRAQMLAADLGLVAQAALQEGEAGLARFQLTVFSPVQPMLAQTAEGVDDALARLHRCALELKLDGARVQVHKSGDEVRVFTRNLNDVTAAVPELVALARGLPARSLILDGETIALGPGGAPLPFQVTMRRFGRKLDVAEMQASLPLSSFFFDCLYLDDESLIDQPTEARHQALASATPESARVPRLITEDPQAAARFLASAFERGHEGAMAKALDTPYEAGSRGAGWLKLKQAHTFDLVILAAEWGSGRRKGWLSNLHLGARDPASGQFLMLGKTFKGLTDAMLKWQTEALLALETHREGHVVFVRPELVAEIAVSDVQASPHYPGGMALRFARVKQHRPDKPASEADTVDAVRALLPVLPL
ncbi:MAG: ATP-dependent DNA ligase [Myxococcales bacterium]|nr:ATP-dependent DNA ligase [Myxococcales bacterium]